MIKVIENTHYHAWFHVMIANLTPLQLVIRLQDLITVINQSPGHDKYDVLIVNGKWQALLTPENNTFHYTQDIHKACEYILGCGTFEVKLVKDKASIQFDSPIEQLFWDEWTKDEASDIYPLVPQHPIGKYYVDFAHIATKTAIELDGHATHSSPDAIAYDRKRQRDIEAEGWHVIRFGGKEVYNDVLHCCQETYIILSNKVNKK